MRLGMIKRYEIPWTRGQGPLQGLPWVLDKPLWLEKSGKDDGDKKIWLYIHPEL